MSIGVLVTEELHVGARPDDLVNLPKKRRLVIGPHARGQLGVLSFMAGYYIAIGIVVGILVGALVASLAWIVVSQAGPDTHIAQGRYLQPCREERSAVETGPPTRHPISGLLLRRVCSCSSTERTTPGFLAALSSVQTAKPGFLEDCIESPFLAGPYWSHDSNSLPGASASPA